MLSKLLTLPKTIGLWIIAILGALVLYFKFMLNIKDKKLEKLEKDKDIFEEIVKKRFENKEAELENKLKTQKLNIDIEKFNKKVKDEKSTSDDNTFYTVSI